MICYTVELHIACLTLFGHTAHLDFAWLKGLRESTTEKIIFVNIEFFVEIFGMQVGWSVKMDKNASNSIFSNLVAMETKKHGGHIGFSWIFKALFLFCLSIFFCFFCSCTLIKVSSLKLQSPFFEKNNIWIFIQKWNLPIKN